MLNVKGTIPGMQTNINAIAEKINKYLYVLFSFISIQIIIKKTREYFAKIIYGTRLVKMH